MYHIDLDLYSYIIEEHGAYYQKQYTGEVRYNLGNTPDANQRYLGTYFPRSFKEAYEIFGDIFKVLKCFDYFELKDEINILDLGSGTGGQIFGLLRQLNDLINNSLKINIYSVDGNENALNIQKDILEGYWNKSFNKHKIEVEYKLEKFSTGDSIEKFLLNEIPAKSIDIVLSFKFLSELLNIDSQVYANTIKASENILKDDGLLVLADVTAIIPGCYKYIPIVINKNIKQYLNEKNNLLNLVIPLCCFYNINKCTKNECFFQFFILSTMIIDTGISSYDKGYKAKDENCKVAYNLFMKNGRVYDKIKEFLNGLNMCTKSIGCYCNNSTRFKEYFGYINFDKSQFSLENLHKKYMDDH